MKKNRGRKISLCLIIVTLLFIFPVKVIAAPYFTVSGPTSTYRPSYYNYSLYLHSGGEEINTLQTMISFDKSLFEGYRFSTLGSKCSFFAPADPALNYGSTVTPYFYNDEKAIFACGFQRDSLDPQATSGELIATMVLKTISNVNTTTSLSFSNSLYKYIGLPVLAGNDIGLDITVFNATAAANPTATPYPSPTPVNPRTVTADDLTFVDIASGSSTNTTSSQSAILENPQLTGIQQVILNNTIPTPGPLTIRPTLKPFERNEASESAQGDILSLRSLRELLIPGKTTADKTVVLINLISTLAFLIILTFLLWRLFLSSKVNKMKMAHMQQLIEGEIAMLLGKSRGTNPGQKQVMETKINEIQKELEKDKK